MQYSLKLIILVQGFGPLKIKIIQFPGGFCLNILCLAIDQLLSADNHLIVQLAWLNNSGYYARIWRRKRLDGQAPCAKLPSLWKESCWRDKILPCNIYINFFQCYNLRIFYSVYVLHVKITIRLILNYLCVLFPIHE